MNWLEHPSRRRKLSLLQDLLRRATALEAKYVIKIISGDLRIGLRESLVEEAIAKAFEEKVQRRSTSQHAAGRHRRYAAAGGGAQTRSGADAALPSYRLHAGQPGAGRGRSAFFTLSAPQVEENMTGFARRRILAAKKIRACGSSPGRWMRSAILFLSCRRRCGPFLTR